MPVIISVVGNSGSGKTTLLVKLVRELKRKNYKVGTIKHAHHGFEIDKKGKDSYEHKKAGADAVMLVGPEAIAMVKDQKDSTLSDLEIYFSDMDVVLVEGFKRENNPKIEVFRSKKGVEPLCIQNNLIAFVTDSDMDCSVPTFGLDDTEKLAEMIIQKLIP
jgi:molybdopterin-guanine dinucleotide biosynthesis adapter protein